MDEQDRLAGAMLLDLDLHITEVDSAEVGFGRCADSRGWFDERHG